MFIAAHWQFAFTALLASIICGSIALYAWQRRAQPGILLFALLMAALTWMGLTSTVEYLISAHALEAKVFASKLYLIGGSSVPLLLFLFALRYTQHDRWLTRRVELVLWAPIILELIFVFTNDWHGLYWPQITTTSHGADGIVVFAHGPITNLFAFYTYILVLASICVFIYSAARSSPIYRRQTVVILAAVLIPALINTVYYFDLGPWQDFDFTPVAYAISGILLALAIFRYQLVELTPVALDTLFANLGDGVLVVNERGRVVAANPAAQIMLAQTEEQLVGQAVERLPGPWAAVLPPVLQPVLQPDSSIQEARLTDRQPAQVIELTTSPMQDRSGQGMGSIVVLHDITTHRALQAQLAHMNAELEERVTARTAELSISVTQLEKEVQERQRAEAAMRTMRDTLAEHVANLSSNLSTLYEVILLGGQVLNVTAVRERALEIITNTFKAQAGFMLLWDAAAGRTELAAASGLTEAEAVQLATAPPQWLFEDSVPHTVFNLPESDAPEPLRLPRMSSCLTTSVQQRGQPVAAIGVFWQQPPALSVESIALFRALVDQLSILAENARLQQVEREEVVQEERRRLARDLHDSVTQALYALALNADTVAHSVRNRQYERVEAQLGRITLAARQALREMRLLLYELRLATPASLHLNEALQLRLDAVERRAGVAAQLQIDPELELPAAWEQELYWVAMEALNNALKHASANRVEVALLRCGDAVELAIADDGVGLPAHLAAGGLGMLSMRERAARLGGELHVAQSAAGGVEVRLHIPVDEHSQAKTELGAEEAL